MGIEFDQARVGYYVGPVRDALAGADMVVLRSGVRKWDDFVPVVSGRARFREALAQRAEDAGHATTAASHWFAAAGLWEMTQWPIWETTSS